MIDYKTLYNKIDEILWLEWDPIGINDMEGPRDEYCGYIPELINLKMKNVKELEISNFLFEIETINMGLFGNKENCEKVAELIIKI